MDVNDRGTMKWTSLMLPEYVEEFQKMFNEPDKKEMSLLDEQEKAEINMNLQVALEYDKEIIIKHYVKNDYAVEEGYLLGADMLSGIIIMEKVKISLKFKF